MKAETLLAHIFSIVLLPLLMPFYSVVLLFAYTNFDYLFFGQQLRIFLPILLFTFIIPGVFIVVLKKLNIITDYALTHRNERFLPYLISIFANMSLVYYFYMSNLQIWFLVLASIPVIISLIGLIISFFWKISTHMMAIGGLIGGVLSVSYNIYKTNPFLLFIVLFILAGCLGTSRLKLKRHTPAQVYIGFILGVTIGYICIWMTPYFSYILKQTI